MIHGGISFICFSGVIHLLLVAYLLVVSRGQTHWRYMDLWLASPWIEGCSVKLAEQFDYHLPLFIRDHQGLLREHCVRSSPLSTFCLQASRYRV